MTTYLDNVVSEIGKINTCAELTKVLNAATDQIHDLASKIQTQITNLEGLVAAPQNVQQMITWCEKVCGTYITAYTNLQAQETSLVDKLTKITTAAEQRAQDLGCS